ncbi:MAG: hypothetical protein ACRCT9_03755 [Roseinatronobacter monicus]
MSLRRSTITMSDLPCHLIVGHPASAAFIGQDGTAMSTATRR